MTNNRPPTHFFKVIFIILILLFFCFPQTALLQTTSVEYICAGTDYETPVYIIKTDYKEPTIMIVAGIHGNEKAGIEAAEYLKENIEIEKGTLIIIPKANILACEENVRCFPPEINLNRVYPGNPQGNSVEKLAYEIFSLMKKHDIGLLVDLHESIEFYRKNPKNYGQTVVDPVKGSTAYCAHHQLGILALTFETCRKLPLSFRIEEQIEFVKIILSKWDMLAVQK